MQYQGGKSQYIELPKKHMDTIIDHCLCKINGIPMGDGPCDKKAFGLVGGQINDDIIIIDFIKPLLKNARSLEPHKKFMDEAMTKHAIPSETPLDQRGWVADPQELDLALQDLKSHGSRLLGTYHMHRVAWKNDPKRDEPTTLDTILAKESRMFMFIVTMVKPETPQIRAFFEGIQEQEALIKII